MFPNYHYQRLLTVTVCPNPFSGKTSVRYSIIGYSSLHLEMFVVDIFGRKVGIYSILFSSREKYTIEYSSDGLNSVSITLLANLNGSTLSVPIIIVK